MTLRGSLDQISAETESKVSGLYARRQSGALSEERFVSMSSATIDRGNARAVVATDRAVAAQASRAKGKVARPAAVRPVSDRKRLAGAVETTGKGPATQTGNKRGKRVERLARTEPYSTAQDTLPKAAKAHGATGWIRQTNPDACVLCSGWADGRVRSFETRMLRHLGCTCLQQPVFGEKPGKLRGLVRGRPKSSGLLAAMILLPNPVTVAGVHFLKPQSTFGRYQLLRIIADTLGVDPFDVDVNVLRAHALMHEEERFRGPRRSPCWKNRNIDFVVHRWLPAAIMDNFPEAAAWLLRSSPRWGRKRTDQTGLPLPKMFPGDDDDLDVGKAVAGGLGDEFRPTAGRWPDSPAAIAAEMRRRWPDIEIDLGNATPEHAKQIAVALERMALRYPAIVADLERFGVGDVPTVQVPSGATRGYDWGDQAVGMSGPVGNVGQRYTMLNPRFAADEDLLRHYLTADPDQFAMRDMDGIVTHELGHHVLYTWTDRLVDELADNARRSGLPVWPDPGDADGFKFVLLHKKAQQQVAYEILDIIDAVTGHASEFGPLGNRVSSREAVDIIVKQLSRYATTGAPGQIDVHELVAEAIAQVVLGKPGRTPGTLFKTTRPSKLAVAIVDHVDSQLRSHGVLINNLRRGPGGPGVGGGSAVRAGGPGPDYRPGPHIASVRPTAARAGQQTPGVGRQMHSDLILDDQIVDTVRRQLLVPGFEDLRPRGGFHKGFAPAKARALVEKIIQRQTDFLLVAAERSWALSPAASHQHAGWYPFAHNWLNNLADGLPPSPITRSGAYAATAALSPGADWAHNVAWAHRLIIAIASDVKVKREWVQARYDIEVTKGYEQGGGRGVPRLRTDLVGKRLSELSVKDAAIVMRGWHDHEPTMQLGGVAGFGDQNKPANPQSFGNLNKAIAVLRDGSLENIDATLGGLKVRSFYNNLADPWENVVLDVTVDSHHFGLANGAPWTTGHRFISTKAGSINLTSTPSSTISGTAGTYPIVTVATRRAVAIFNERHGTDYLPNQFQSIVWEMHRAAHPSDYRTEQLFKWIEAARTARAMGRITRDEEARLVEAARLRAGSPTEREILIWFKADLAGQTRELLSDMRKRRKALRRGQ